MYSVFEILILHDQKLILAFFLFLFFEHLIVNQILCLDLKVVFFYLLPMSLIKALALFFFIS